MDERNLKIFRSDVFIMRASTWSLVMMMVNGMNTMIIGVFCFLSFPFRFSAFVHEDSLKALRHCITLHECNSIVLYSFNWSQFNCWTCYRQKVRRKKTHVNNGEFVSHFFDWVSVLWCDFHSTCNAAEWQTKGHLAIKHRNTSAWMNITKHHRPSHLSIVPKKPSPPSTTTKWAIKSNWNE